MMASDDKPDPMQTAVMALRPWHTLPPEERPQGVAAPQGRPRKIAPATEPTSYAVALDDLRQQAIESDPLVRGDDVDALQLAMLELARESASLRFERQRLERLARDASAVSSRRIDALVRIAARVLRCMHDSQLSQQIENGLPGAMRQEAPPLVKHQRPCDHVIPDASRSSSEFATQHRPDERRCIMEVILLRCVP